MFIPALFGLTYLEICCHTSHLSPTRACRLFLFSSSGQCVQPTDIQPAPTCETRFESQSIPLHHHHDAKEVRISQGRGRDAVVLRMFRMSKRQVKPPTRMGHMHMCSESLTRCHILLKLGCGVIPFNPVSYTQEQLPNVD